MMSMAVYATETEHMHEGCCGEIEPAAVVPGDGVIPQYELTCPGGGKHIMRPIRGNCPVYEGSYSNPGNVIFYGQGTQCTECYLALISEGNPYQSGFITLGRYALWNYNQPAGNYLYAYGGITGAFYGSIEADPFWGGFDFVMIV